MVFSTPAKDQQTQKESNNSGFALDLDDSYFIQRLRVLEIIGPVSDSKSDRLHELRRPSLFYIISNSFVVPYYEGKVFFIEGGLVNKTELSDWQSVANYAYTVLNDNRTQAGCKIWFGLTRTLVVLLRRSQENRLFVTQDLFFAKYVAF